MKVYLLEDFIDSDFILLCSQNFFSEFSETNIWVRIQVWIFFEQYIIQESQITHLYRASKRPKHRTETKWKVGIRKCNTPGETGMMIN